MRPLPHPLRWLVPPPAAKYDGSKNRSGTSDEGPLIVRVARTRRVYAARRTQEPRTFGRNTILLAEHGIAPAAGQRFTSSPRQNGTRSGSSATVLFVIIATSRWDNVGPQRGVDEAVASLTVWDERYLIHDRDEAVREIP